MTENLQFCKKNKMSLLLQSENAECGHACVAMILNFYGYSIDLTAIRKINNPSIYGVTLKELHKLFESFGFSSRALRLSLNDLKMLKKPAIIHWNMNHFVVLERITNRHMIIYDPACGIIRYTFEEASKFFTGIVLEIEKEADFSNFKKLKKLKLYDLVKASKGFETFIVYLLFLSLSIEILSLINPLFIQYVTDKVIGSSSFDNLIILGIAFSFLSIIEIFAEYIRGNMAIFLTSNLSEQLSSNIVKHILKLPLDFFEKRHKGDIQSKFQSVEQIQKKISTDFINTLLDGLMIVINIGVMFAYSSLLTFIVLLSLFLFLLIRVASYHSLKSTTEASTYQHAKTNSIFLEILHAILPIKSFLMENNRFNWWRNCYIHSLNADIRISKMEVYYNCINKLLFNLELIFVVTVGAFLVLSGSFSAGMMIAFLSYRLLLVNKTALFIHSLFDFKLISIQLTRLSDILFQEQEVIKKGHGDVNKVRGSLVLNNVSFKYNLNESDIFSDINIQVDAGEKIVIVGRSGCGKSTLLKVMMGLFQQTQGIIYLDDIPINEFGL